MATVLSLAACAEGPGPDAAELTNMNPYNFVPKSSATQFVETFDAVCTRPPAAQEARARDLSYIPAERRRGDRPRLFVVDDRRPALRLGTRLCLVEAVARAGQTDAARRHVARTYPAARAVPPQGADVENLWRLPDGGLIATRRFRDAANLVRYSLLRYREGAA